MLDPIIKFIRINVIKNWKTALTGVTIVFVTLGLYNGKLSQENAIFIIGILTGYGLIIAKDGNKTGV